MALRFAAGIIAGLFPVLPLIAAGAAGAWLPRAFAAFCARRALHVVESEGYPWIEIDFPEDYWRACTDVLPAIDVASSSIATTAVTRRPLHV